MALAVVTVASGGMPVVDATASGLGLPVSEMPTKFGLAVTKVAAGGRPVVYAPANSDGSPPVVLPSITWSTTDKLNETLSGGNLTATASGAGAIRGASSKNSGKYYFEITYSAHVNANTGVGIANASATLANLGAGNSTNACIVYGIGNVYVNNAFSGSSVGTAGNIVGIAIDLDTYKIWMRTSPSGLWYKAAGSDPVTGVGGVSIAAIASSSVPVFPAFSGGVANDAVTANFGASAFSGAVPSGFTAGWPA